MARYRPSTGLPTVPTVPVLPFRRKPAHASQLAPATLGTRGQMALPALHARQAHTRKRRVLPRASCVSRANTPPSRRARHQRRACPASPFRGRQRGAATALVIAGTPALKQHARHAPQARTKTSTDRRRVRSVQPTRTLLQLRSLCSASVTLATRQTPWGWHARRAPPAPTRAR